VRKIDCFLSCRGIRPYETLINPHTWHPISEWIARYAWIRILRYNIPRQKSNKINLEKNTHVITEFFFSHERHLVVGLAIFLMYRLWVNTEYGYFYFL